MAQVRARSHGRLTGRFGLRGRVAVGVAAALLLLAVTAVAVLGRAGGVVVERATPQETQVAYAKGAQSDAVDDGSESDSTESGSDDPEGLATNEVPTTVLVHVDGAVESPGVYELPGDARANDAVLAAGGLAPDADTASLNLAAPVTDGEKIHVPVAGEGVAQGAGPSAEPTGGDDAGGPVNINTADVEELDELPGVGEATARAIVEEREANGPFSSPEDIMRVSGIGEKKFARLEAMICV